MLNNLRILCYHLSFHIQIGVTLFRLVFLNAICKTLQRIQNKHAIMAMFQLHWVPIKARIELIIYIIYLSCLHANVQRALPPVNLTELVPEQVVKRR